MLGKPAGLALAAPLLLGLAAPATAQSVDDVLAGHYEAIGGLEEWKALESMRLSGTLVLAEGVEAPFTMLVARPGRARMEFTIQGMTGVQGTDGETAWTLMPFLGQTEAEPMPPAQARAFNQEADVDGPLVGYEESGLAVELAGTEEVDGTEAYQLRVTYDDGRVRHFHLDAESDLPLKIEETRELSGEEITLVQRFDDYREVGDLVLAHTIEVMSPAGSQVLRLERVELDVEVDDSVFSMPARGESP